MNNTDRIRELQQQIRDAGQRLDRLRAELARFVVEELGSKPVSGKKGEASINQH